MIAKIICMYCKAVIRTEEWVSDGVHDVVESHGVCHWCAYLYHPKVHRRMQAMVRRAKRREALRESGVLTE